VESPAAALIPDRRLLLATAEALGQEIWDRRETDAKGGVNWLGPRMASPTEPFRMAPIGPHLYSGKAGVALFLAALANVLGKPEYGDLSLQAIASLRSQVTGLVADRERATRSSLGLGGTFGVGAVIYSLVRIGVLLGEPDLVSEAHAFTALLTPERVAADHLLDVVLGAAGALLALLALAEVAPEANETGVTPLELAAACGDHLIGQRVSFEGRPRAWVTIAGHPPLSGFSHGAAGICCALLRLYGRTARPELLAAAEEGLAFERTTYDPVKKNWRDMRVLDSTRPRYLTNWCHGAPGVALGRLGALDVLDTPEIRDELERALETTAALPQTPLDHVCCGNMGRAEVLLCAAGQLAAHRLDAALELTGGVLDRARQSGHFGWLPPAESYQFDPSFFSGAAGLGYTLLRLAEPDALPCVLLLA